MTKRGRKAAPDNVRRLSGDTRPSRQVTERPAPNAEPEWAEWLDDKEAAVETAREVWERVARYLRSLKIQSDVDTDMVRAYVLAVVEMDRLGKVLAHAPAIIRDTNGQPKANPVIKEWRSQADFVRKLGSTFGMVGPGSRQQSRGEDVIGSESRTDDLAG